MGQSSIHAIVIVCFFGSIGLFATWIATGDIRFLLFGIVLAILWVVGTLWVIGVLVFGLFVDTNKAVDYSHERIYEGDKNERAQAKLADQRLHEMFEDNHGS